MRPCLPDGAETGLVYFSSALKRAAESQSLRDGRQVHDHLIRSGRLADIHNLTNCLIQMYGHCGSAADARSAFDGFTNPDLCSWNVLMKAYGLNGFIDGAQDIFNDMPKRDVVSWTTMISLLAQHDNASQALQLYQQMQVEGLQPNKITFISALNACASARAFAQGITLHVSVIGAGIANNVVVGTAVIKMYSECGKPDVAWSVFSRMPSRDAVTWNAMIAAFAQNKDFSNAMETFKIVPKPDTATLNTVIGACLQGGNSQLALTLFHQRVQDGIIPSVITFVSSLNASASCTSLKDGHLIHLQVVKLGIEEVVEIGNALITMYGKCKSTFEARSVFLRMPFTDVVSWTAIMVVCNENDQAKESLDCFQSMQVQGIRMDEVAFVCALDACAVLTHLEEGQKMNDTINKLGLEGGEIVKTALIDMYGKCGNLQEARCLFFGNEASSIATWNAFMTTLAHNGLVGEVVDLLDEMIWQRNATPNDVTFGSLLTACNHAGWVDNITQVFLFIGKDHGVAYTEDHYVCMVDVLARAGQLEMAEALIRSFPFERDEGLAWQCLLATCKIHNDHQRAATASTNCFSIDPWNASSYALICSIRHCSSAS